MIQTQLTRTVLAFGMALSVVGPALSAVPAGSFLEAGRGRVDYRVRTQTAAAAGCAGITLAGTNGTTVVTSATAYPATPALPAFCDVVGTTQGTIGFEVALPASWNRRLYVWGNGGWGGEPNAQFYTNRDNAIARGFTYARTDTGHTGNTATAFTNNATIQNWADRSIHLTAIVAKQLALDFYGTKVARSYYEGCSTGGRQAFTEALKYPTDFDGIIAGDPANLGTNLYIEASWQAQQYDTAPFTLAQANAVGASLLARCGENAGGFRTGVIADPRRCKFDPKTDGAVLTAAQVTAYEAILSGAVNKYGRIAYGEPLGAEVGLGYLFAIPPGPVDTGTYTPVSLEDYGSGFFEYLAPYEQPGATFSFTHFNFDTDTYRLGPIRSIVDAYNPDLRAFAKHGGKIIGYHGWADPLISPYDTIAYVENTWRLMGVSAARNMFREFMVPGMGHCGDVLGGYGPDTFDMVTPLVDWVEAGVPPDNIVATGVPRLEPGTPFATAPPVPANSRLLCAYPEEGRYVSGDPTKASSFRCVAGLTGLPSEYTSGTSGRTAVSQRNAFVRARPMLSH